MITTRNSLTAAVSVAVCFLLFESNLGLIQLAAATATTKLDRGCHVCRPKKKLCRKCPKCQHDYCILKCENALTTKKNFDVDQKVICIPKVTFPWQKCCNRCAKTRTVNILGVKKYECCECKYSWKVVDHPLPGKYDACSPETAPEESDVPFENEDEEELLPKVDPNVRPIYEPSSRDVPTPPPTNKINNG